MKERIACKGCHQRNGGNDHSTHGRRNGSQAIALSHEIEKRIKEKLEPAQETVQGHSMTNSSHSNIQEPPQEIIDELTNLFKRGQVQATLNKAQYLLQKFPNAFILHKICGITLASLNHNDAAIESYKKAINIQPESAQVHFNMGVVLQDTGALEAAMWSLLGSRGVDVMAWENFGKDWVIDVLDQLKIKDVNNHSAEYGKLPDLNKVNFDNDVITI